MGSTPAPNTYSASQVSTLIGLNPYATSLAAFQILKETADPGWNARHGYTLPPKPDNAAIRWGNAFEDSIIKLAEEREDVTIYEKEKLFEKEIKGIKLSCHIDGKISEHHPGRVLHEGKTTNHFAYTTQKKEIVEALDLTTGKLLPGFKIIRRWGDPGTDEVPQEYQIQAAVQRICTGAELVKLTVLVFPTAQADYEDLGWIPMYDDNGTYTLVNKDMEKVTTPMSWARPWAEQGQFHTYNLPSNPALEQEIITAVQRFHINHMQPGVKDGGIPPNPTDFDDVRRLIPNPIGSILATPELITLCIECGENAKQLGTSSPLRKRQADCKVEIMTLANAQRRSDPITPPDKMLIINPNGGDELGTLNKNKNGVISFQAARAR